MQLQLHLVATRTCFVGAIGSPRGRAAPAGHLFKSAKHPGSKRKVSEAGWRPQHSPVAAQKRRRASGGNSSSTPPSKVRPTPPACSCLFPASTQGQGRLQSTPELVHLNIKQHGGPRHHPLVAGGRRGACTAASGHGLRARHCASRVSVGNSSWWCRSQMPAASGTDLCRQHWRAGGRAASFPMRRKLQQDGPFQVVPAPPAPPPAGAPAAQPTVGPTVPLPTPAQAMAPAESTLVPAVEVEAVGVPSTELAAMAVPAAEQPQAGVLRAQPLQAEPPAQAVTASPDQAAPTPEVSPCAAACRAMQPILSLGRHVCSVVFAVKPARPLGCRAPAPGPGRL